MESNLQERVDIAMSGLPPSLIELEADRHLLMPYIQHVPESVEETQHEFLKICADVLKSDSYIKGKIHRQGIIGRFLDDSGNDILSRTWYRFMCIDENYREWVQPYYAINYKDYKIDKCECINDKYPDLIEYFRDRKIDAILENKKVEK